MSLYTRTTLKMCFILALASAMRVPSEFQNCSQGEAFGRLIVSHFLVLHELLAKNQNLSVLDCFEEFSVLSLIN